MGSGQTDRRKLVSIVIPCYNEEEAAPHLIYKIKGLRKLLRDDADIEFVLVDDGSKDRTYELLSTGLREVPEARIVRHPENRGFGAALRTGLDAARGDTIVTIDADTNYEHFEIPIMIEELSEGFDIVTASPWHPQGSRQMFSRVRAFMSVTLSGLYARALGTQGAGISTFTSGFRVYRRRVIEEVKVEADDFLATAELLIRALQKGFRVKEFPTAVYPRRYGRSKLKTIPTICSHLRFLRQLTRQRRRLPCAG